MSLRIRHLPVLADLPIYYIGIFDWLMVSGCWMFLGFTIRGFLNIQHLVSRI